MPIPIQNIYYLLSYAWNLLGEGEFTPVSATAGDKVLNLLASLLHKSTLHLLQQGLTQQYSRQTATLAGIKGKINLTASYKNDLLRQGRAVCTFEALSTDVLPNQLIRATLSKLMQSPELAPELQPPLRQLFRHFEQVSAIVANDALFAQLPAKFTGNRYYEPVLHICRFLHQNLLPEPSGNNFVLQEFWQDERQMGQLFERFVRNFLKQEQQLFGVKSEKITWQSDHVNVPGAAYLPLMITDISLFSAERKIIIDTKFYRQALVRHYDKQKLIAGHLYQLFAYLKNDSGSPQLPVEGILLYPVVEQELDLTYQLHGHKISIKTINLAQPWQTIKADLLRLAA